MNSIKIRPKVVLDSIEYEGIGFSNCTFIDIDIDGRSISQIEDFDSGVVIWDALQQSVNSAGKHLLFTCYCGIPDDAGWDYVQVEHTDIELIWSFERNRKSEYIFRKSEYIEQIAICREKLNLSDYPLAVPISMLPET